MDTKPKAMIGYIRVSRRMGRQGPGYISKDVQRDAIQRWADYRGVEIVEWYTDEDQSGGTQIRPGLCEAMKKIENREVDGLACWRLNRFARNVSDAIKDVERIHRAGAHLACIEEDIDPTGPFGRFILTILLAVATLERDNAVASFEEAKRRAVARGAYVSRTPFGYQRNPDGTLSPHPEQGPIVTEAFGLAAQQDLQAATAYLTTAVPSRRWTASTTRRLLAGRSYLGETRNGTLHQADTHEPLVSRAAWEAAQSTPARRRSQSDFPLSGLARCGSCGAAMIGSRGGKGQRTYRCSATLSTSRAEPCSTGVVITASRLESYVHEQARDMLGHLRITIGKTRADVLAEFERQLLDAEKELDDFAGDLTLRAALGDRYRVHLASRIAAVDRARAEYRKNAREAAAQKVLTAGDLLTMDDPALFLASLGSLLGAIVVTPGRGLAVERRVSLVPLEADGAPGIPAAKRRQQPVLEAVALDS